MPRQDSFLHLLVRLGLHERYPDLAERLATEDIIIPNMPYAIALAEVLHDAYESQNKEATGDAITEDGAQSASKSTEHKWATVPRPSILRDPIGYCNARRMEATLQQYDPPWPGLDCRFEGLTDLEKGIAWHNLAIGASIAGPGNHEALDNWLAEVCHREHIQKPRLVIMDLDRPEAGFQNAPGEMPSIFISSNLIDILSDRQLRAVIAHELGHSKETNQSLLYRDMRNLLDRIQGKSLDWQKEFRADAFSARVMGSPDDLVDAITVILQRNMELRRFARQVTTICQEYGFDVDRYFLFDLEGMSKAKGNIFPDPITKGRRRGTHPSDVERFDALYENDSNNHKHSPSR